MNYSKNDFKNLKKQLRSKEELDRYLKKEQTKSWLTTGGLFLGTVAFIGLFLLFIFNKPATYSKGIVHWHAELNYNLCGDKNLLTEKGAPEGIHPGILHGHNDGLVHVEGDVPSSESIILGAYFDEVGISFDKDRIGKYKNGESCPGSDKPGMLKFKINGEESTLFRDYVVKDGDKLEFIFE